MQMRKFGFAGKPNCAQRLSALYLLIFLHPEAALAQMAILGLPAAAVVYEDALTALAALDPRQLMDAGTWST